MEMEWAFMIRGLKICSLNNAYATRDRHKKVETLKWMWDFKVQMLQRADQIQKIKARFNPRIHFLDVEYIWFVPEERLTTKSGAINTRSGDCSNFAKIPDDLAFNDVLGLDDGCICKESIYKVPSPNEEHWIRLIVRIRDIQLLREKAILSFPAGLIRATGADTSEGATGVSNQSNTSANP